MTLRSGWFDRQSRQVAEQIKELPSWLFPGPVARLVPIDALRLWDLVRHQRAELHDAGLITDDEYAALASDGTSRARLETYDELRKQLDARPVSERTEQEIINENATSSPSGDPT